MKALFFLFISIFAVSSVSAVNIIPYPSKVSSFSDKIILRENLVVSYSEAIDNEGSVLCNMLENDFGIRAKKGTGNPAILLKRTPSLLIRLGEEGYQLTAKKNSYTWTTVEVYYKYNRLAIHPRNSTPYAYTTSTEHLASTPVHRLGKCH